MAQIPLSINGIKITFSPKVNRDIDIKLVKALKSIINKNIIGLKSVYISSANDQHRLPSRHMQGNGKAIDISRINGMKMSIYYNTNMTVQKAVKMIQSNFEKVSYKRENFGPFLKKKLGKSKSISGHGDHIHLSIN